ncbi:MAG: sodium/hydrogen exchanger [Chloroflexi bacterium]|nr:sodium/hydrogen exchanger [Chloroflexota bacterium]
MELLLDLVAATVAALIGGIVAFHLRQPALVGYLVVGVLIGPGALGLVHNPDDIEALAQVGVALLLFAIGVEFDLRTIAAVRRVVVSGGLIAMVATTVAGLLLNPILGVPPASAALLGLLVALSSTMAALKILGGRGEVDSLHGRIAVGILIVQDLCVVPVAVLLPLLAEPPERLLIALGLALAKAAALLAGTFLFAGRIVPWALFRVAATRSNELFILTVVGLALGTAVATEAIGLSIAFGAFLAGIVVSRSDVSHRVVSEAVPLRDVFSAIFFISAGTLIEPRFLLQNAPQIAVLTVAIVLFKYTVTASIVRGFGLAPLTALATGAAIAHVGEFSIVLGQLGARLGILEPGHNSMLLALTLTTILVNAPLQRFTEPIVHFLGRLPLIGRWFQHPHPDVLLETGLSQHVVICGYGRVGSEVAEVLKSRGFRYLVIDLNPYIIADLRKDGVPCIYGDASREEVLRHTGLERARALACMVSDQRSRGAIVSMARSLHRRLDIVARARDTEEGIDLRAVGATEVVLPEFEAGLEVIRHLLHRYGVSGLEIQGVIQSRREAQYRPPLEPPRL